MMDIWLIDDPRESYTLAWYAETQAREHLARRPLRLNRNQAAGRVVAASWRRGDRPNMCN